MKKFLYWIPAYFVAVAIFYFSSLTYPLGKSYSQGLSGWIFHFFEYAVLSLLVYFAMGNSKILSNKVIATLIFVLLFAVSDEIHQLFVPGRVGSLADLIVDLAAGIAVMAVV